MIDLNSAASQTRLQVGTFPKEDVAVGPSYTPHTWIGRAIYIRFTSREIAAGYRTVPVARKSIQKQKIRRGKEKAEKRKEAEKREKQRSRKTKGTK